MELKSKINGNGKVDKHLTPVPNVVLKEKIMFYIGLTMMTIYLGYLIAYFKVENFPSNILMMILAGLGADFLSGLMHWSGDTWGSIYSPFVGETFIKPLRIHHFDILAFTRHHYLTTNGDNFFVFILHGLAGFWYLLNSTSEELLPSYNFHVFLFTYALLGSLTTQIHKWAHTKEALPWYVTMLQKSHIIMPRWHHLRHHCSTCPETYFCIATGWMNYPLEKFQFWKKLEKLVTYTTGVQPRTDDFKWVGKTQ